MGMGKKKQKYLIFAITCAGIHLITIFFGDSAWWIDIWSHFQLQLAVVLFCVALSLLLFSKANRPYAYALACYACIVSGWVAWSNDLPQPHELASTDRVDIYYQNVLYGQTPAAHRTMASNISRYPARVYAFVEPHPRFIANMHDILGVTPLIYHAQGGASCAVFVTDPALEILSAEVHTDPHHDPLCHVRFSSLDLFVAHPLPPLNAERYMRQDAYFTLVTSEIRATETAGRAWLLVGDLNTSTYSARFRNAFGAYTHSGHYTWRTNTPLLLPIDHAFGTIPHDIKTTPSFTSDHQGLVVMFTEGAD